MKKKSKKKQVKTAIPKKDTPPYNFESLNVFKDIISTENRFRLQIITLESLSTFMKYLKYNKIDVNVVTSTKFIPKTINVTLNHVDTNCSKVVLFNNKRHPSYIQIVFKSTISEIADIVQSDFLVKCFSYKSIEHLLNIKEKYELKISEFMKNSVDYFDSVVLITVFRHPKFKDVVKNVSLVDSRMNNVFVLKMRIDSLVSRNILSHYGHDSYRINISDEGLDAICMNIGFDFRSI